MEFVGRATFESPLAMAQAAPEQMDIAQETAQLAKNRFRGHKLATLDAIFLSNTGMRRKPFSSNRSHATNRQNHSKKAASGKTIEAIA